MASLGALGFIKGASSVALDSIQQRQKEEAELRKAKMLEELRAATAKDLANFEDLLSGKKVDSKLSGFEGDEYVMRNAKGEEISRRAATAAEKEAMEFERQSNRLSLDKAGLDIENTRSTIESRKREDAREDMRAGAYVRSLSEGGSGRGGSTDPDKISSFDIAKELRYQQAERVKELERLGVPASAIVELSEAVAANGVKRKLPFAQVQAEFKEAAKILASGTETIEDPLDATKKTNRFSLDRFTRMNPQAASRLPKR